MLIARGKILLLCALVALGCGGNYPADPSWVNEGKIISVDVQSGTGSQCLIKILTSQGTFLFLVIPLVFH